MIWTPERQALAVASLNKWQGTPHKNRIAVVGVGVDCIKLVYEVLVDSNVLPRASFGGYDVDSGMWAESTLLQDTIMNCMFGRWVTSDFEFGDIFIMKTGKRSAHCGFYTADGYIWHALARRFVTRSDFVLWKREIVGMVRLEQIGFRTNPDNMRLD